MWKNILWISNNTVNIIRVPFFPWPFFCLVKKCHFPRDHFFRDYFPRKKCNFFPWPFLPWPFFPWPFLALVYKSFRGQSPKYLGTMLELHTLERTGMRSERIYQRLKVPVVKLKTFAARSFSVVAPQWWSEIFNNIKQSDNVEMFKFKLKTYLFDLF